MMLSVVNAISNTHLRFC